VHERVEKVRSLLHEAAETHHTVFRIVDGADDDWTSWYANWLVNLSELPEILGAKPVRGEVTAALVGLAENYGDRRPDMSWEEYYARGIVERFGADEGRGT
jgi:hypothetical protein